MKLEALISVLIFIVLTLPILIYFEAKRKREKEIHDRWHEIEKDEPEPKLYLVNDNPTTEVPEDAFVFVLHRGVCLPMRVHEKRDLWDRMNRSQRNEQVEAMKIAVRKGKVIEIIENGYILYFPKSKDLKKIQKDYADFLKLGGNPEK